MQEFPHHYKISATALAQGDVNLTGEGLDPIVSAPPAEFGGPGNHWSPETLLTAAVADCFTLGFRAIARASKVSWVSLKCEVEGTLDRVDGTTKFTQFVINATLEVPADTKEERAHRILEKAEAGCLITNSLSSATRLKKTVLVSSLKPAGT